MEYLLLSVGLLLILLGANYLTEGAATVAHRLRMPEFVIGLTIVAVGTSMPELVVSLLSAIAGNSAMALGNIVGSNLFNTLVIGGVCALICPLALTRGNIRRDIPIGFAASALLWVMISDRALGLGAVDRIGRAEGVAMLLLYVGVVWISIRDGRREERLKREREEASPDAAGGPVTARQRPMGLAAVMIAGGLAGLLYGGEVFLHNATAIARNWGVSEGVIAITLVAGGTSLPELASSVVSMLKGKAEMALGNIVGSNVANILLIAGLSSAVTPLTTGGLTALDFGMVTGSAAMLFVAAFTFRKKALDRWEGAIFLSVYILYICYLVSHAH